MYVRIRVVGEEDRLVVVHSKLMKIEQFRNIIYEKFNVPHISQRLLYGGKLLEDGYTLHDYNIKLNDVIQLLTKAPLLDDKPVVKNNVSEEKKPENDKVQVYKEALSDTYAIGDYVDVRCKDTGSWLEGRLTEVVLNPVADAYLEICASSKDSSTNHFAQNDDKENDMATSSQGATAESQSFPSKGRHLRSPKNRKTKKQTSKRLSNVPEEYLYFKVQTDVEEESYYTLKDIRPRASIALDVSLLKEGDLVMLNHNLEHPLEIGNWYDFKISKVIKQRRHHELCGTLYFGPDSLQQMDTTIRVIDKIFLIEDSKPGSRKARMINKILTKTPEKRSQPLKCLECRDKYGVPCQECGCYVCSQKHEPENILLCDDCDQAYHMKCLQPPLSAIPEGDWYCPSCKRHPTDVIAPGAAKQTKKTSATSRDWGRGMACVGKTKTCAMPTNHFGPIPGIEVGMCWRFRIQLSESGVHRPPVSGIHGRDLDGAYSIVLSGGYEDDVDNGVEFTYTGSGGRDLSGNKRTAAQSSDQALTRENRALARNCAVKLDESGADAGDKWRLGKPVRVVRSCKMLQHFPKYAPKEGIRYDGIYKVVKYYQEKGLSGFRVWKYLLRRDDPSPAPWERGAKHFDIIYPDGYLEAEAEKKALKAETSTTKGVKGNKKGFQRENEETDLPPAKKRNIADNTKDRGSLATMFKSPKGKPSKGKGKAEVPARRSDAALSAEELAVIKADTVNTKQWNECLEVCEKKSKQDFIEYVSEAFLCIICQGIAVNPVTTRCLHNFCLSCLKSAFKSTDKQICPYCRQAVSKSDLQVNERLRSALRAILSGYDSRKK